MPTSAKRGPRGGQHDARHDADVDPAAERDISPESPTRPSKRRRRASSPGKDGADALSAMSAARAPRDSEASSRLDDDQLVAQVAQHLKAQPVQASKDYANAIHEANSDGVKAYAKLSAQDWTYYITELVVNIGRALEPSSASSGAGAGAGRGAPAVDQRDVVHVDLGPSKMVSREHASISFDSKEESWMLYVKGRNGAKMNGKPLKAQAYHPLSSGEVIEIGNVEMIFVLPSELGPLHIDPVYLARCGVRVAAQAANATGVAYLSSASQDKKLPGTPSSAARRHLPAVERSPLPAPMPVVRTASGAVDLTHDDNRHIKPQFSYAQMITQAILNAPDKKVNLNGIYTFIMNSYAYYRHQSVAGWQNSIRHNLSLNKSFDKVARSTHEPGKGMKWQIVPEAREEMTRNAFKIGRGGHRGSSAPSSPNQLNYITHGPRDMAGREPLSARKRRGSPPASPPDRHRPPIHAAQLTPDRTLLYTQNRLTADGSPLPRPRNSAAAPPPDPSSFSGFRPPQSPTLTSSYLQDDGGSSFVTPAPPRVHPRLAPPSTAQRPSQHMPTSSPAPFWKYADIGSTPLKPMPPYHDHSPSSRTAAGAQLIPPAVQSSSPSSSSGKTPPSSPLRPHKRPGQPEHRAAAALATVAAAAAAAADRMYEASEDEPDEEHERGEGFDLMKGFQSIGSYHAPVGQGASVPSSFVRSKS